MDKDAVSLAVQEHPAGRGELSSTRSFLTSYQNRSFEDSDISDIYHANSKFDARYLAQSARTESNLPESFSAVEIDFPGLPTVELPTPESLDVPLHEVLKNRRSERSFRDEGITKQDIATVLGHAAAPTETERTNEKTETFRPYPSGGGLFPVEIYPVILDGKDVADGIYYYSPRTHCLRTLNQADGWRGEFLEAFMDESFSREIIRDTAATFVLTGCFSRSKAKYGPAGYRFTLFEAGHVAQNLLLTTEGLGLGGVPIGSFLDDSLDSVLNLDGVNEASIYPIAIGHPTTND